MAYVPELRTIFFYTTETPHRWSSGPSMHRMNNDGKYISSLEEAEALAREEQSGLPGQENYVKVSWGTTTELDFRYVKDA